MESEERVRFRGAVEVGAVRRDWERWDLARRVAKDILRRSGTEQAFGGRGGDRYGVYKLGGRRGGGGRERERERCWRGRRGEGEEGERRGEG